MKYKKKPVVVEVFTFDEFVEYGIEHADHIVEGEPLSFKFRGSSDNSRGQ